MNWKTVAVVSLVIKTSFCVCAEPSFQGLGTVAPDEGFYSVVNDVSAEGNYAIGLSLSSYASSSGPAFTFFKWSREDGMTDLDWTAGQYEDAAAISADGTVIVANTDYPDYGIRWTETGAWEALPPFWQYNRLNDMSGDGSIVVGASYDNRYEASYWDSTGHHYLANPTFTTTQFGIIKQMDYTHYTAVDISDDGSTIVGNAWDDMAASRVAIVWRMGDWSLLSEARQTVGISGDGGMIIGTDVWGNNGWRWSESDGFSDLDFVPVDLNHHGSVILGANRIWSADYGTADLFDQLQVVHGLNLSGWTSLQAVSISDDGLTIVGNGVNPDGLQEAWIACIPEPSTVALSVIGFVMVGYAVSRRRRR